ncbi:DNA protecting protein DprA [Candidatus Daviesbacteria bacterium RIFCSPHIGHO2_12_FULL_37_11]|uniref:DNA protecting protein DprA n=1 Tax=Candidatus Daviesbacteria bacterium RIFCSPHIGHO2_12_FULL_37_11 TaxID=1797777 RepID=A0A1F5K9L4_9BACT|nr:MAG: DNA protecting protein DprA [Candidatus Daviesbacteria bacterium RIFCSPHIGHO2_01_FULL_37_27]OGE37642.1 MAG: DNA protecting protein DprA [Candidatus Daviesbacteria bacterium RIFCSPHIGHO2_12_FULL_37_11]OGE45399.1 MAG: DNA protecting protein DprA [Candidatus Daviesbacteria bacterium RIFCSPLOWO2_01_FULL_37_10]
MVKDVQYLLALHSIDGLGPIRLKNLLDRLCLQGDARFAKRALEPRIAWEASRTALLECSVPRNVVDLLLETRKTLDPEKYMEEISEKGIKWKTIFDEDYPKLLKEIYDPPLVFYYKGEILPEDSKALAVVGTRKITGYGKLVTEKFTSELVTFGFTIVSGLARGVDSAAHWAAVNGKGRTIAVLGGGLNKIFPPENERLAKEIENGFGAVISEFPPDYPSVPGNFPARNRIISGLSLGVLVTEAAVDSGSLITARFALEQGREVFAVPGPVTSDLSKGPIDLIKEGAALVSEAGEILEELGMGEVSGIRYQVSGENLGKHSEEEKKILEILENESKHIDEIGRELKLHCAKVSASLLKMEISGMVRNLGSGIYCKI